ncbi:MAG: MATE family efflux transporter [Chloroflexota bacterium]|nr:MATE family efflux transporter [Chloroflexota bacterium]
MKEVAQSTRVNRLSNHDLTSGNLHRNIWRLALPMILEMSVLNVSQILDALWIGRLGSAALAAVTISAAIRWVINGMANGLGIGGMAVVARRVGARNPVAAGHAVWQTILLGVAISALLSGLGLLLARPMLVLLGADAEVLSLGVSYLRITLSGLFVLVLQFAINSMLRGAGEARLAMSVLFLHTAVTVVSEWVLIFGRGPFPALGVAGAAWGNVLGLSAGVVLQAVILLSGKARIGISLRDVKPDFPLMGQIIRIALPSMVQMTLRSASRLIVVGLVGLYGTFATAGYGVANRLLLIAIVPGFGLGNTAGTLVGQNMGARKPDRAERNAWWVSVYAAGYMTIVAVLLFVFARPLIELFDPTPQVVDIGAGCLRVVTPTLIPAIVGLVLARGFDGAGDTAPAMVINLLTLWGVEAPFAYGLAQWLGLGVTGIWCGRAIAHLANGLLFALWFRLGRWKRRKV